MKVLFLSAANSIHTVKWVNALVERGHDVLLVYNKGHEPNQDMLHANVKRHGLKYRGNAGYYLNARELRKVSRSFSPDLVNVHYASGYGTLARIARLTPTLLSVWGSDVYDFPYESKLKNIILKKNVQYADELASTSNCMANQLRKVMGNSNLEVAVTPFGVDTEKFSRKYSNSKKNLDFVIGNIKMLKPKYGVKEIILAVDKIVKDRDFVEQAGINIRFKIYGDGEQKKELYQIVKERNLEETVEFLGKIPNDKVPDALNGFDVFCAFSQLDSESFGVAVVEAMAMEVPVVVSDVDGFKEVVDDSVTGFIVPRDDIEGCAEALKKLILDSDLRDRIGKAGRKRVLNFYDWKKNVDLMEDLYCKVVQKKTKK